MRPFRDRDHAGQLLAAALKRRGYRGPVVLGIPRGGVPVAAPVARELGGDLGVIVARKLRAPGQPELAIGAITASGAEWINEELAREAGASPGYLDRERRLQSEEASRREAAFDGARRPSLARRTVIIVDDGLATGATAIAAVRSAKAAGAECVVLAVPVAPPHTLERLRREADQVFAVEEVEDFFAVGQFYDRFDQIDDRAVTAILDGFERDRAAHGRSERLARVRRPTGELAVRLVTPGGPGPFPAVVFVHGLGSSKESPRNAVVAERLVDLGLAAALFDLGGHGESTAKSGTIEAYAGDLQAVVQWVCEQPAIDGRSIGVNGSSLGAIVALCAVRAGLVEPRTMVLRAPPVDRGDLAGHLGPTLVVVGAADPLRQRVLAEAAGKPGVLVEQVAGAGHLFEEPGVLEAAVELTAAWFARHLAPRGERAPAGLAAPGRTDGVMPDGPGS